MDRLPNQPEPPYAWYSRTISVICVNISSPRDRDVDQVYKLELSSLRSRHRNCFTVGNIICQGRNARLSEELEYAWPMTNLYPPRGAPSDLGT